MPLLMHCIHIAGGLIANLMANIADHDHTLSSGHLFWVYTIGKVHIYAGVLSLIFFYFAKKVYSSG